MGKLVVGFVLFSCLYLQSAMSRFVVEKNSLTVSSPDSIKGNHDSAIGNFGIPQNKWMIDVFDCWRNNEYWNRHAAAAASSQETLLRDRFKLV
ncbi:hypothetical protein QVD17_08111 [Tagetes erecta]|uniref:Uncharacterized protein n=1 Tax=Tagetes erecta TaxID=13708 RepID=A0AAD8KXR3_TARER|nr:hypothetical protein QVD17_08111 [Tagetes erecta]